MAMWLPLSTARLHGRGTLRDPHEEHRVSTPLELLFDLTFVVAVARAAAGLHHALAAGHVIDGLLGFTTGFFGVWWGWMNYTWFATCHDSDDVAHRLLTLLQMAGVLVFAAGFRRAFEQQDFLIATVGYAIMRSGLVLSWLRVARDVPVMRPRALRYAVAIVAVQGLWFARLGLPPELSLWTFAALAVLEMLIPLWAERYSDRIVFHAEHIEERYGLFTIIVLGESILSAAIGFDAAADAAGFTSALVVIGVSGLVLAFAAWWLYFDHPGHLAPTPRTAFRWGYGHVVVFAALAASGAGMQVAAEATVAALAPRVAALAVATPTAGFLFGLVLIMVLTGTRLLDIRVWPKLVAGATVLIIGYTASVPVTVVSCAAILLVLALWMVVAHAPRPRH